MQRIYIATVCISLAAMLGAPEASRAGDWDWDDIAAPYLQRIDTQTSSSGNAQRVNTVTHMITPWPRNVRNRRIPASGQRMVGAVQRYQDGNKQRLPMARKENKDSGFEIPLEPPAPRGKAAQESTTPAGMNNNIANVGKSPASASAAQSGSSTSEGQDGSGEQSGQ